MVELPSAGWLSERKRYLLPPKTGVYINVVDLHNAPQYWGDDAAVFRPSRWIETGIESGGSVFDNETLVSFTPGQWIPFASGPRSCLGMKFAQVEIVAVLGTIFGGARLQPTPAPGVSASYLNEQHAWRLAEKVLEEKKVEITATLKRPHDLWLKWMKL